MSNVEIVDINRLPYGDTDFSYIREENMIYVDKTKLIANIAAQRAPIFFSRPRRFGKSLLISILHNLFSTGLKYFHGLDIEKIWNDKTYKVVHLDFSSMANKDSNALIKYLGEILISKFGMDGIISQLSEVGILSPDRVLDKICRGPSGGFLL